MPQSLTEVKETLDQQIEGFIQPIWSTDPIPGRRQEHGLGPDDFRRVVEGYACPECLAKFKMVLIRCPACGHVREFTDNEVAKRPDWDAHLKARKEAEEVAAPSTPVPRMDQIVDAIMRDRGK